MEIEIKPKVMETLNLIEKNYNKMLKYQNDKLTLLLSGSTFTKAKERGYKTLQASIVDKIKALQLSPGVLEELVQLHYSEIKKIITRCSNIKMISLLCCYQGALLRKQKKEDIKHFKHQ